jgi:fatty acid desaturase
LGIVLIIALIILAIKAALAVKQQSDIFKRFEQSRLVALLALISPLVPVVVIFLPVQIGYGFSFAISILITLALFIVPNKQKENFEIKGRDQVALAIKALEKVQVLSIICFIYLGLSAVNIFLFTGLSGNGF